MQPDPTRRSLIGNRAVKSFEQKPISEFEPIKTEDLFGRDFIIFNIAGELSAGQFGPSWVVEITSTEDTSVGHSWLVNQSSVLGKQILEMKNNRGSLPVEVSLEEMPSATGRSYFTFAPPKGSALPWNDGKAKGK